MRVSTGNGGQGTPTQMNPDAALVVRDTTPSRINLQPVLACSGLTVSFSTPDGELCALDDIGFSVARGEILGVVGESGCGKSLTALSIMGLLPESGRIRAGRIRFEDLELTAMTERQFQSLRGNRICMIFQEPMTSLNPVYKIGRQLMEPMRLHQGCSRAEARQRAIEALEQVGMPAAERRLAEYPHQMSGGMRQRVMIAMAIACHPSLLIADEPTTALDVTIQAQILDLIRQLVGQRDMAVLFITHDLGVVAELCHRVLVMYAGQVIEQADVGSLFDQPLHPYTQGLLASIPRVDTSAGPLAAIGGVVPGLVDFAPQGCRFAPRCRHEMPICLRETPSLQIRAGQHGVACHLYSKQAKS
jgi:peptide/nickel transport system ATP-binding protein